MRFTSGSTVQQPIPVVSRLKRRHLQFLAIGGVIGAGFFLGFGIAISQAGPALLLAYLITGAIIYLITRALGELTLAYPAAGSFSTYTTQFIGPLAGFITGWSYWLMCTIGGIAEISARLHAGRHYLRPSRGQRGQ